MSGQRDVGPFFSGSRVALVKAVNDKHFGVAMRGGHFVCPLPDGYDGRTTVHWVDGWIIVRHPHLPPLLADTTTGNVGPMNEQALAAAERNYVAPPPHMRLQ